jgi:hypothetical protein
MIMGMRGLMVELMERLSLDDAARLGGLAATEAAGMATV